MKEVRQKWTVLGQNLQGRERGRAVIVDNIHVAKTCGASLCVYAYYLVRKIQQKWTVLGQNLQGRERGRAVIVDNIHVATTCGASLCVYAYYLVRKIHF